MRRSFAPPAAALARCSANRGPAWRGAGGSVRTFAAVHRNVPHQRAKGTRHRCAGSLASGNECERDGFRPEESGFGPPIAPSGSVIRRT
jgi:hypothetical protein